MLKFSRFTDYAVTVLVHLSRTGEMQAAPDIAKSLKIPAPTIAKTLKILTSAGIIGSQRGVAGGYRLVRPAETITLAEIITATDGPIALTACVENSGSACDSSGFCPLAGRWDPVNLAIKQALSSITLADMQNSCKPDFSSVSTLAAAVKK